MFSPMVAIASEIAVSTVTSPTLAALIFSTSAPLCSATCAIILTRPGNCSLRATKSVSELTSTTTPLAPEVTAPIRPSAATRPAFLAAFDRPFLRSQSCAAGMSPAVSVRAALQSIMPAPVDSRSSLTIAAEIVAIFEYPSCLLATGAARALRRAAVSSRECSVLRNRAGGRRAGHPASLLFRFRDQRLGLGDQGIGAARKTNLFTDLVRGIVVEFGELPVVEDAEVVELLLDRPRHAGELLEVVGGAARTGQALEAGRLRGCRNFLADRLSGGADIDAVIALGARDAVDGGAGDQVAIQRNGAAGVVIARHHEGDALGVGIGIDDRGNGNVEPLRFLDRDVFLVGVDHEDHVGKPAHVLDAAERTVELVALALQREPLLLGVGRGIAGIEHF